MKTTIPVFTCGYCGNMNVKQGQERCSACDGRFDWENSTVEDAPSTTEIKSDKAIETEFGKLVAEQEEKKASKLSSVFLNVPTWASYTATKGPPQERCPCQGTAKEAIGDHEKPLLKTQKYSNALRNVYKTEKIVIIGVGSPFDMMKVARYRADHPNTTSMFSSKLVWMFAGGNDRSPHASWIWNKDKAMVEDYAKLLFKVIVADVDEIVSIKDGKIRYNVARHVMKVERSLSPDDASKAIEALPSNFKVKSIDDIPGMKVSMDFGRWCTVEGMVLWKRLFEFGNVVNVLMDSQGFDAKPLTVMVPKMHDINDVNGGDIVIVTGDWFIGKTYDKVEKRMVEDGAPKIHASGIVPISKVDKDDLDYLAGFK